MNWKETYTKVFLKQSDIAITEANVKEYMSVWWQNTRSKEVGGLRLTDKGFLHLTEKLDIQSYDVPFPDDFTLTTSTLIWLDQFIDCPYWLGRDLLRYGRKESTPTASFRGDVKKYGLTKALKRTEEH